MTKQQDIEYDDILVTMLEIIWGEGFLSPGGAEEVALLLEDDNPPTPEMGYYLEVEGLNFGMASPERYAKALARDGSAGISLRDRNAWYSDLSRKEYEKMKGPPLYPKMIEMLGHEHADHYIEVWRAMNLVIESGELRPGHLRAIKPLG